MSDQDQSPDFPVKKIKRTIDDDAIALMIRESDIIKIEALRKRVAAINLVDDAINCAVQFLADLGFAKVVACNIDDPETGEPKRNYASPTFNSKILSILPRLKELIDQHPLRVHWRQTDSENRFYRIPHPDICPYEEFMKLEITREIYEPMGATAQIAYRLDCFGDSLSNLLLSKEYDPDKSEEKQFSTRQCGLLIHVGEILNHRLRKITDKELFKRFFEEVDENDRSLRDLLSDFDGSIDVDLEFNVLSVSIPAASILAEFKMAPEQHKPAPQPLLDQLQKLPIFGSDPQTITGRVEELTTIGYCHRVLIVFVQHTPGTDKLTIVFKEDQAQKRTYDKIIHDLKRSKSSFDLVKAYELLCQNKRITSQELCEHFGVDSSRNPLADLKTKIATIVEAHGCSVLWR